MGNLRASLARLLEAVPPSGVRRPTDLQRSLDLNLTLSWQVFQVAHEAAPGSAGIHVPKARAMKRVLDAAARRGVPRPLVDRARTAFAEFDAFVEESAGDRISFDSIVRSAMPPDEAEQIDLPHRRALFRGFSHLLGVQAQTRLQCAMIYPGTGPLVADTVLLQNQIGLRRLRRDATRVIGRSRLTASADASGPLPVMPLEDEDLLPLTHRCSLLKGFSTVPLEHVVTRTTSNGEHFTELADDEVGNDSSVTCVLADVARSVPRYADRPGEMYGSDSLIAFHPIGLLIHDLLVADDLYGDVEPEAFVTFGAQGAATDQEPAHLPQQVQIRHLGKGPSAVHTPEVPRYEELMWYTCARMGWDPERFDVYRCRVEYPLMHSTIVAQFTIPEAPSSTD